MITLVFNDKNGQHYSTNIFISSQYLLPIPTVGDSISLKVSDEAGNESEKEFHITERLFKFPTDPVDKFCYNVVIHYTVTQWRET